ncbi:molybdate ABC transporter substrate-binding protein [Bosea psychrotolerans]|uniref:Molybdate transport system substrate-binding protein n=1 Tax=Bosea psychrotolerans TaxID=1871628 RepID=A0A2S4ML12_9HYPH|nr:substrate-binding domain-containing protein [Bosea psychrotolerans]POR55443.1 molybdate transport system substrate-binding protein [Bosea psychrotolerans]
MRITIVDCFMIASLCAWGPAGAAEVKVLTAGAFKPIVQAVAADFEKQSGHKLVIDNDTAGGLLRRITGGEAFDLAVLTPAAVKELVEAGRIASGTPRNLARTSVGVAVKDGAPRPDIATVAAFKATLLAAGKVAYIDPAAGGSSGIYFAKLLETMGIADAVKAKAVLVPGGLVAQRLVTGEADLAIHQISEILAVKGATLVGPLPAEIQNYTTYTGGIAAASTQPEAAKTFLAFLGGDSAKRILAEKGMEGAPD